MKTIRINPSYSELMSDYLNSRSELESLKKVYNDLAESHAKQVIDINDLKVQASNYAYQMDLAKRERDNAESELLKAKERFCQCSENDKTGSTSAMHCNHCGKIEQSETWLK